MHIIFICPYRDNLIPEDAYNIIHSGKIMQRIST